MEFDDERCGTDLQFCRSADCRRSRCSRMWMCMHEISYYILRIVSDLHAASAVGQPRAAQLVRYEIPVPTHAMMTVYFGVRVHCLSSCSCGALFGIDELAAYAGQQLNSQKRFLFASRNWQYSRFCSILIISQSYLVGTRLRSMLLSI